MIVCSSCLLLIHYDNCRWAGSSSTTWKMKNLDMKPQYHPQEDLQLFFHLHLTTLPCPALSWCVISSFVLLTPCWQSYLHVLISVCALVVRAALYTIPTVLLLCPTFSKYVISLFELLTTYWQNYFHVPLLAASDVWSHHLHCTLYACLHSIAFACTHLCSPVLVCAPHEFILAHTCLSSLVCVCSCLYTLVLLIHILPVICTSCTYFHWYVFIFICSYFCRLNLITCAYFHLYTSCTRPPVPIYTSLCSFMLACTYLPLTWVLFQRLSMGTILL